MRLGKQGGLGPRMALGIPVDLHGGLRQVPLLQPAPAAPPASSMVSGVMLNVSAQCCGCQAPFQVPWAHSAKGRASHAT